MVPSLLRTTAAAVTQPAGKYGGPRTNYQGNTGTRPVLAGQRPVADQRYQVGAGAS
jgi:hypothetical protein